MSSKHKIFTLVMILGIIVSVDFGLRLFHWGLLEFKKNQILDERMGLSPYKSQPWARAYFKELSEALDPPEGKTTLKYEGNFIRLDEQGFRKTWNPHFSPDSKPKKIYIFGGSTVWGDGVREDYTLPSLLSRKLNADRPRFEVHNFGKVSFSFVDNLKTLNALLQWGHRPYGVLFYLGFNDVLQAYENVKDPQMPSPRPRLVFLKNFLEKYSMIYALLQHLSEWNSEGIMASTPAASYDTMALEDLAVQFVLEFRKKVEVLEGLSKKYDFRFVFLWQPTTFTEKRFTAEEMKIIDRSFDNKNFGRFFKYVHQAIRSEPIPNFYDLSEVLSGREELYYTDWCHLTEGGNGVVARKIDEIFRKKFLK